MADKYNIVGMCASENFAQDESVNFIINIFIFHLENYVTDRKT